MQHLEEGVIHAWLDGELSLEEASALEQHVALCGACSDKVIEARGLVAASSRIVSALDGVPAEVVPMRAVRRKSWYSNTQFRAAAAVLIVAGASLVVLRSGENPATDRAMAVGAVAPAAAPESAAISDSRMVEPPLLARKEMMNAVADKPAVVNPKEAISDRPKAKATNSGSAVPRADETAGVQRSMAAAPPQAAAQSRISSGSAAGAVVGSERESAPPTKERRDSVASVLRTTYRTPDGREVVLAEYLPNPAADAVVATVTGASNPRFSPTDSIALRQRSATPELKVIAKPVNVITWTSRRGRTMTLSGAASLEELLAIKLQLPDEKKERSP